MTNDEAIIAMVDANVQREEIPFLYRGILRISSNCFIDFVPE